MLVTRVHIALLAVMSVFTGVIAPITQVNGVYIPLPMTNMRMFAFSILFLMVIAFITGARQHWKIYNSIAGITTLLIGVILGAFIGWFLTIQTPPYAHAEIWSWGWIFLFGWVGFFFLQSITKKEPFDDSFGIHYSFDLIIAYTGGFTLLVLTGVIIFASIYQNNKSEHSFFLNSIYGTGIKAQSGILVSPGYEEIGDIYWGANAGEFAFAYKKGEKWNVQKDKKTIAWDLSSISHIELQENTNLIIWKAGEETILQVNTGVTRFSKDSMLSFLTRDNATIGWIVKTSSGWVISPIRTQTKEAIMAGSGKNIPIISMNGEWGRFLWWTTQNNSWILRDSARKESITTGSGELIQLSMTENGAYFTALIKNMSGSYEVVNDNNKVQPLWNNPSIIGSYKSNGKEYAYSIKSLSGEQIFINGLPFQKELFQEIRNILVWKNGKIAFFARNMGEKNWCFYTERGVKQCDIKGYMNPRFTQSQNTVLFAAHTENSWKIYKDTSVLSSTDYSGSDDISKDWFFIDTTSGKHHIFYQYDSKDGKYAIIKDGKRIETKFDDVGTDVIFLPNWHSIITAKIKKSWHIVEIK